MSEIKLPLAFSMIGHAIGVALLILLMSRASPVPEPIVKGGIEVVFAPPPAPEPAPVAALPVVPGPSPTPVETEPPPEPPQPQPSTVATKPLPPAPEAPPAASEPPPPHKLAVKKPPKPVPRRQELPHQPTQAYIPPTPAQSLATQATPAPIAPPQTAAAATPVPAPVRSPEVVAGYRALLSAWLESHKRYPESARERGEEGHAVLRFLVDRSGRVLDYAITSSSGYIDLDHAVEEMMSGASLPPFPAGMLEPRMEVSVTIRFSLRR